MFILDEATSALDPAVATQILSYVLERRDDKLVLLISHRLFDVTEADRILVLRDGQVVESGSHSTLLSSGGEYATLWSRQGKSTPS